jgi:UDP-N-acetyl-D-glucosamine dehydrogenase
LRAGQLVVLESTTLPGTTLNIVRPILERTGLKSGIDFYLSYSPEREDPGNLAFSVSTTPKIVGGDGRKALEIAMEFYACFVAQTVPVSSMEVAETAKLVENAFRAVNIALANEIKAACEAIGIDVWEVIDAAKSKPFGYMPFYPGPGTGGHCIPVDPVYLVSEAHARGAPLDLIETALRINAQMPERVVRGLDRALAASGRPRLRNAKILMVGLTYKKNVNDFRESPALRLIALMAQGGASVDYFDPHIESFVEDEHERRSIRWQADLLRRYDAAVIATDHDDVDYKMLADLVPVVLDTRNIMHRLGIRRTNVFQA